MQSLRIICEVAEEGLQPDFASEGAAGADLRARLEEPIILEPGERRLVPTGVRLAIPSGYEGQIRPRSGLALASGVTLLNSPGTIDSDYRGEVQVILVNLGQEPCTIRPRDRIAQLVVAPAMRVDFAVEQKLPETKRGEGGFGSTGR